MEPRPQLAFGSFGTAPAVLDVDFEGAPAPQLVTSVLAACASAGADEDDLWALPVGLRLRHLLAILVLEGGEPLWAEHRCSNAECGEPIEVDLSPAELLALAGDASAVAVPVAVRGETLTARRPTGADQLTWQARVFANDDEARRGVVVDLLASCPAELDDELVDRVEAAIAAADPLVSFDSELVCPYCSETRTYEVDLAGLVLARFRRRQEALVRDVHALASRYHWTEAEILAVPAARRSRYLALVDLAAG